MLYICHCMVDRALISDDMTEIAFAFRYHHAASVRFTATAVLPAVAAGTLFTAILLQRRKFCVRVATAHHVDYWIQDSKCTSIGTRGRTDDGLLLLGSL